MVEEVSRSSCFTIVCADAPQALTPRYFSQVRQARFACARRMNRDGISCSEHANSTCPTVALLEQRQPHESSHEKSFFVHVCV